MHFLGLDGMPRRVATYPADFGLSAGNFISTVSAFVLGVGVAVYFGILLYTMFRGPRAGPDPWDARTLEWSVPHPSPEFNFAVIPEVHAVTISGGRNIIRSLAVLRAFDRQTPTPRFTCRASRGFPSSLPLGFSPGEFFSAISTFPGPSVSAGFILFTIFCWASEGPGGYLVQPVAHPLLEKDG